MSERFAWIYDPVAGVKRWVADMWSRRHILTLEDDVSDLQSAISGLQGKSVPYGYCTTAADTVAKTVTVSPAVTALTTGLTVAVKFQYANTASNPTINVNGLGAVAIKRYGTTAAGTSAASNWNANSVVMLTYDGTYWMMVDFNNTTYSGMTDAEYQAGTGTTNRLITPKRLKAAILYHAPVQSVNGSTGAVTVNVPTKTSDLTNDSGFLTSAPVTSVNTKTGAVTLSASDVGALPSNTAIPTKTSQLTNDSGFLTSAPVTSVNGQTGAVTVSVPTKTSDLTNDSGFITSAPVQSVNGQTGAVSLDASDVGALPDTTPIPTVPTNVSAFTNDAGYLTSYTETDPTVPNWAKQPTKPSYTASEVGALPSSTAIPSKTSDLVNDSGFITGYTETDPTVPAWAKAASKPSYTASEVGALPDTTTIPANTSDLTNDSGFITASAVPDASSATPVMDGTGAAGTSNDYARADHVHPSDTSKQDALTTAQLAAVNSGIKASDLAVNDASVLCTVTPIEPTLSAGTSYTTYGGVYYYKIGHRVTVHIGVNGLTANTNTTLFTLPAGYRPHGMVSFGGTGSSLGNVSQCRIETNGDVKVRSAAAYAVSEFSFDAFQ